MIETLQVIYTDFNNAGIGLLLVAAIFFAFFAFVSHFFKWFVFRIIILVYAFGIIFKILGQDVILFDLDLYSAMGLIAPHLKFMYIIAFRLYYAVMELYEALRGFIQAFIERLINLYNLFLRFKNYFKRKEKKKQNSYEGFKKEQYQESYQKQGSSNNQRHHQSSNNTNETATSRWDSSDPYIILDIHPSATGNEIKKQYRKLQKIYHPDLTQTKKDEYTIISQKLNAAYAKIK